MTVRDARWRWIMIIKHPGSNKQLTNPGATSLSPTIIEIIRGYNDNNDEESIKYFANNASV